MTNAICRNCGRPIGRDHKVDAPTGWTHVGDWQGRRCVGEITGAVPMDGPTTDMVYFAFRADEKGPPSGPTLSRELAERWAEAEDVDAYVVGIDVGYVSFHGPSHRREPTP
jgi:hypothetical protein